jgi:UDP-glucuronate 4-epimerase
MATKVLLTGAAGLVGRSVATRLRKEGVDHVGIDIAGGCVDGMDVSQCDVRDVHRLNEIALTQKPMAIIHCGAYSGPMLGRDNPAAVIAVNVGGTANLLEIARLHGIKRFVFCSSVSAVGPTVGPVDEKVRLVPTTVYGATKAACEHLIYAHRLSFGIEAVCLRLASVWGPNRTTACALGEMIKSAVAGRELHLESGGYAPTQYLHVDDAAEAIYRALVAPSLRGPVYNIAGNQIMTLSDVGALVRYVFPGAKITVGPGDHPSWEWQDEFLTAAAAEELGFTPRVGLEDGMRAFARALSVPISSPGSERGTSKPEITVAAPAPAITAQRQA